jgi:uncharacterized membrane protein HdeD (DUF308 family)
LLGGTVGLVVGLVALGMAASATAGQLVFLVAAWAFVTGVLDVATTFGVREDLVGERVLLVAGIVSLVFALLLPLLRALTADALTLTWSVSAYAVLLGCLVIATANRLRRHAS